MVLKFKREKEAIMAALELFPSPCGDMVLKLMTIVAGGNRLHVSVPLRGYGFEIFG